MTGDQSGLEVGRRRFLHPGPLRWLRAMGWMVLLFVVFSLVYAGAQMVGNPLYKTGGQPLEVLEVTLICAAGLGLYALVVRLAEGRWPEELSLRQAPAELAIGLAIGAIMLSMAVGGLYALGVHEIGGPRTASPMSIRRSAGWCPPAGRASGPSTSISPTPSASWRQAQPPCARSVSPSCSTNCRSPGRSSMSACSSWPCCASGARHPRAKGGLP